MDVLRLPLTPSTVRVCTEAMQATSRRTSKTICKHYQRWQSSCLCVPTYLSLVGAVSIYDIVLTILYAPYLKYAEENPIGRWIMGLDNLRPEALPDLTLFLTMKSAGTVIVLLTMYFLILWRAKLGHPVAFGVSLFQVSLAWYLTFATTAR